jgi:class 3 adenylate cyclase/tetratricopeptide (TPR) repeat protein
MKFCGQCAAPLASTCPSCGAANPPENKFCGQCATALRTTPTTKFAAPDSYTPKHLAERILTSRAALEGERKQVTVLFADLKGSMEMLADRDPEEARKILDPVLELMMEAVHRYEGTVNQVMGDGIMALFGAPLAHEDHAVRACYAALRMQEAVRRYSDELRRAQGVEVQIRVGVNSGEVVVRSIGSDLRMDYSAVGQVTNLAARMEQLAAPGSIRLTTETLQLAEGFVRVTPLGPVPIKGLGEPIEVFELVGGGAARTRLEAAAWRGLTRFVGRTAELEQLRDALERASLGHGQVVAVVGEPGVGKSRLFWELLHSHRVHGWLIVQSASVSYGKVTAYLPVIELLRGYFAIESRDDARKIREKVTGKVLTLSPALGPAVPALLALLDVPVDEAAWQTLDPLQRRQQTLDAVKRLLLRESEIQPLVVIFEDLHWIDGETQTLLDSLVESLPAARLLFLVNYRPEYSHAWSGKTYYRQLRIDPLPPESADELLDALLGADAALGPLKQLLVERTEANPLFLEESVRALVETAALAGERGAYRLTRPVEHLRIPATVQAVLAARIDRLAHEDKQLLQLAAVIGTTIPYSLLRGVSDLGEDALRSGLSRLHQSELLYETQLFPDIELTFTHVLTHEVAYHSLLLDRRRRLHVRILEVIETQHAAHLAEHVERLAHHALHGELWDKAFDYLRQAARRAVARAAYDSAVELYDRAIGVLERQPAADERLGHAVDVRLELRAALVPLGRFKEIHDCLHEAERLATQAGDAHRLALVHAYLTNYFQITGDLDRAIEFGSRAMASAQERRDHSVQVLATSYLSSTSLVIGDFPRAVEFGRQTLAALDEERVHDHLGMTSLPAVYARLALVRSLSELGDFGSALDLAQQSIAISLATGDRVSASMGHLGLGYLRLRQGPPVAAIEPLEAAAALARSANPIWFQQIASTLASAYVASGRALDGLRVAEEATGHASGMPRRGFQLGHGIRLTALGEAFVALGRLDEAHAAARDALEIFTAMRARGYTAWTLRLLGAIASARDAHDAEDLYQQARALAVELGMRPLEARCDLDLGYLYRRGRRPGEARAALTRAADTLRSLSMVLWSAQAETYLAEIG